jgi:hypothetical protein
VFDFSRTFHGVNTDFFFNFSDIFLISPTSDPSDFLLNRAVRAVLLFYYWLHVKTVNCYVYYDLFCYTERFVYFGAIFMLKMKQKLRPRTTTGSLPTACKQRMIPDICYRLWLIMIDTKIFWFQMISTISWLIKCMLSIWRLNLFIKRHVSLKVNIYYSHMCKLILEPCAWICKHP